MRRVGIFGWGLVAPRSPDIDAFERNLESTESWLSPFDGFGPNNFLVGDPEFYLESYRSWVEERFKPNRYAQIESKMGMPVQYALGAFIQALGQNPGLEDELKRLGHRAHVYVGTGLGDLPVHYEQSLALYRAQRLWDHFWAAPERNSARRAYEEDPSSHRPDEPPPLRPETASEEDHAAAQDTWWRYWAERSDGLHEYLDEARQIESLAIEGSVEEAKLSVIKEKTRQLRRLQQKWSAPTPPWQAVSANLIWNIDNIAAAQISMLGGITGMAISPVAACSTFGVTLKMAFDAIQRGEADAVVIGATDPPPHPLSVGAFYSARVVAGDGKISKPLTELRGTHVAGGSAVWIVGELDHMRARGFEPLGLEPVAVGVTSDADHIITPSKEGPTHAMRMALDASGNGRIGSWDLHATATPGDFNEVEMVRGLMDEEVVVTARKGTFGHGMSAGGGWELTAQYLGHARGALYPTPLRRDELNEQIAGVHQRFVYDASCPAAGERVGKLSMGIGGVNACVVSRPYPSES